MLILPGHTAEVGMCLFEQLFGAPSGNAVVITLIEVQAAGHFRVPQSKAVCLSLKKCC